MTRSAPRAQHVGGLEQEMPACFVFSGNPKPSLRVCCFLDKFLIDFQIFCLKKTWDKSRAEFLPCLAKTRTLPPLLLSIVFFFVWTASELFAALDDADHEFLSRGLSAFLRRAPLDGLPDNLLLSGENDHRRSLMFEMCWIYAKRLDLSISKGIVLNEITCKTFRKCLFINKEC